MSEYAVKIDNGTKFIAGEIVLENLNMRVKRNSIYSLFGASGCGKTTLLKIIADLIHLDSGQIFVAKSEKHFGILPQSFSLFVDLTVDENLKFFGKIYGMRDEIFVQRTNTLAKFFELNQFRRSIVSELSGGEKQRASLIAALLHRPKLIILDEPTVNLDLLLRDKIWKYLKFYCNHFDTTIIFSSHSMSEIQQADIVAFLRNGRFLCEDSPETLMSNLKVKFVEEIFYKLSEVCEENSTASYLEIKTSPRKTRERAFQAKNFAAIMITNLISLRNNWRFNFYLLFHPLICILYFANVFGRIPKNIPITVKAADDSFKVNKNSTLNCNAMISNKETLCNESFDHHRIFVNFLNPNNFAEFLNVKVILQKYEKLMRKIENICGFNSAFSRPPLAIEEIFYSNYFGASALTGAFFIIFFYCALVQSFDFVFDKRNQDVIERIRVLKVSRVEIFFANFLNEFLILFAQFLPLIPFILTHFDCNFGNLLLIFVFVIFGSICSILLANLIREYVTNDIVIRQAGLAVGFILIYLSGSIWPIEGMPKVLRFISHLLPLRAPIESFQTILLKQSTYQHPKVQKGLSVLVAWILVLGFTLFKKLLK